jgi:RNA polymerase sigma-70 factor, ECF subfamily
MDSLNEQFGHIYDQYIDKIYRFVFLKVNSQEIAEDVTSKVFLKGWESFKNQGLEIKNPGAFLYQIARNAVIDHYRDKGRTKIVPMDANSELKDPGTSAQEEAILSADILNIRKAIQKLGKEHQNILIWHYLDDMSIDEIAKLLGRPAGTVRVMLHRGLKDLKEIIQEA